ncbi:uncharacterized protein LOC125226046 [Leguminivora glycinivorella]|uniref:uncharacterized protein LOC125226046 n=1 Tax=Leguminivora glycinivorella TaxID=1035111 RepID=UPI00200F68CF|nr:uncharacterized protein LOC125226046 [Leguminivora glycinivorella]
MRRARRDLPRVFVVDGDAAGAWREADGYPARVLPLEYRQSRLGVAPAPRRAPETSGAPVRLRRSLSLRSFRSPESAPRPQFALEDAEEARVYEEAGGGGAFDKAAERYSAANLAEASAADERKKLERLERKVLNTERYNNGAAAAAVTRPLLARSRRGSRSPARRGSPRAAIRFLLGLSTLFYSLALLAFYFLSLSA